MPVRRDGKNRVMNAPEWLIGQHLWLKLRSIRSRIPFALGSIRSWSSHAKAKARRWHAMQWRLVYVTQYRLSLWKARYGGVAITLLLILPVVVSGSRAPA